MKVKLYGVPGSHPVKAAELMLDHKGIPYSTITAIDPKVPSISFTGPNGWAYSTRVEEKNNLDKVKVGDKVDITWTSAALIAFEE